MRAEGATALFHSKGPPSSNHSTNGILTRLLCPHIGAYEATIKSSWT
jgi:hypothetical protein